MPAYGRLALKDPSSGKWISNLSVGGTKVRYSNPDGSLSWIRMTVNNTKVYNPEYNGGQNGQPEWITLTG